jgi:hypothetical protein
MGDLTYDELTSRLGAECGKRRWRVPSKPRLKKLRSAQVLPEAKRYGREWRYPAETVAAYIRAEEVRRSTGKRVRSWKLVERRDKVHTLRAWLADLDQPVPRELIAEMLEELSTVLRRFAPVLYGYVENPVGPLEDDRLAGAHAAIEATLDAANLRDDLRAPAEALLQILIFRDEAGNAEDIDLAELLEPVRQQAGPLASLGGGIVGICGIVREIPLNELLTRPRGVLDGVTDEELRISAQVSAGLLGAFERVAMVANKIVTTAEKARSDDRVRGDVRLDWLAPIANGASSIVKILQSDFGSSIVCALALVSIWRFRLDPKALDGSRTLVQTINAFASLVEQATYVKTKPRKRLKQ